MPDNAFIGEIRSFSFDFAPEDWAQCNGQLLPINQNQALFSLLGTTYGGDGATNFGLPNLQGRVPIGMGAGGGGIYNLGDAGGVTKVTLSTAQTPSHTHIAQAGTSANSSSTPFSLLPAAFPSLAGYTADGSQLVALNPAAVMNAGGGQPHDNMQPSLVLNLCICITGMYPSRS